MYFKRTHNLHPDHIYSDCYLSDPFPHAQSLPAVSFIVPCLSQSSTFTTIRPTVCIYDNHLQLLLVSKNLDLNFTEGAFGNRIFVRKPLSQKYIYSWSCNK